MTKMEFELKLAQRDLSDVTRRADYDRDMRNFIRQEVRGALDIHEEREMTAMESFRETLDGLAETVMSQDRWRSKVLGGLGVLVVLEPFVSWLVQR